MNEQNQKQNEQKKQREEKESWLKGSDVESFQEETVLSLTEEEAKKCRYMITDPQRGIAECYVHRYKLAHGIVMFPKHLYDLRAGKLYCRMSKDEEWIPFKIDFIRNMQKLVESQRI